MRGWLIQIVLLGCQTLSAMQLKDGLRQAKAGDYVVTLQDRAATVLMVRAVGEHQLVLEEVTAPISAGKQGRWTEWIAQGAPGHASWNSYLVDLDRGYLQRAYSYSRGGWLDMREEQFLSTLLRLRFSAVPNPQRKRVGPLPRGGPDRRPIWNPPLVVSGQRRPTHFYAYKSQWPRDGTPLAGREVTLYCPEAGRGYPSYFPYWLEVKLPLADTRLRVIDSGQGLSSPKPPRFTSWEK